MKTSGSWANYRTGARGRRNPEGIDRGGKWQQIVGSRAAAMASAKGGTTVDVQARTAIDQILATLQQHGLIET